MRVLEKIRRIFASDASYQKRDKADLMSNAPWMGNYDRSSISKDMHGGVVDDAAKEKNKPSR